MQVMMERPGGLLEWEGVGYGNATRATYKSSAGTEWRACTSLDKCHTASSDQLVCGWPLLKIEKCLCAYEQGITTSQGYKLKRNI